MDDRSLLVSRARYFLQSPQISGQNIFSKRQFLREKGLHEAEIDALVRDTVSTHVLSRKNGRLKRQASPLMRQRSHRALTPNLPVPTSPTFSWGSQEFSHG
jgi:hypothetical protein